MRLVGISSHQKPGRARTWVGAYLPGHDAHYLWAGVDWESLVGRWHDCTSRGMRIVDAAMCPHPCKANALNQVVMPTGSYDYGVTGPPMSTTGRPTSSAASASAVVRDHRHRGVPHAAVHRHRSEAPRHLALQPGQNLSEYTTHLNATGCPRDVPRQPDPAHWGTDQQAIAVAVGDVVSRGQMIAWAGNTGPGGKKGAGGPNTHLHIFWTRRDADGRWYFHDPYGLYAPPDAYPAGVTAAPSGPCVRYPVGWRDGRPQYP